MQRALTLAKKGQYSAKPNPCVGCVIVKNNQVIGEGWHQTAGEHHAEVHALNRAGDAALNAQVYVTLEPCSHHGKTPPCADALINANVARVVVAMLDPNPLVSGQGVKRLREAGIDVQVGLLTEEAEQLNTAFVHKMKTGRPLVTSKVAMSLDGRTAMQSGESQWITGCEAREDVHRMRAANDVVLTGIGTVLADNPQLTARDGLGDELVKQPQRVVLDSTLRMPKEAALSLQAANVTILTCSTDEKAHDEILQQGYSVVSLNADKNGQVDLKAVQHWLNSQPINSVMIEAGAQLNGAFLKEGLVDALVVYMAPSVLGSDARGAFMMPNVTKLADGVRLTYEEMQPIGDDIKLTYTVNREA